MSETDHLLDADLKIEKLTKQRDEAVRLLEEQMVRVVAMGELASEALAIIVFLIRTVQPFAKSPESKALLANMRAKGKAVFNRLMTVLGKPETHNASSEFDK